MPSCINMNDAHHDVDNEFDNNREFDQERQLVRKQYKKYKKKRNFSDQIPQIRSVKPLQLQKETKQTDCNSKVLRNKLALY